jgi:small-conductance mechanosensitive channel
MSDVLELVGPQRAVQLFGVRLMGVNADNGKKLLFTAAWVAVVVALAWAGNRLVLLGTTRGVSDRAAFWGRQGIRLAVTVLLVLGVASIWFDDPKRFTTALGLFTAALVFALQKVITAVAGYVVIMRGKVFGVGDRIVMGGVRGDVIALDFTQTTIMEMGQPPPVQGADPAIWVRSREYTGRIVTVSNALLFEQPVYNYSRDFPYLWEELVLPISYSADRARAEAVMLEAAQRHTESLSQLAAPALAELQRRYAVSAAELQPRVYFRATDNWLELSLRFVAQERGVRALKDAMTRDILRGLEAAGIGVASATFEVVGLPEVRLAKTS